MQRTRSVTNVSRSTLPEDKLKELIKAAGALTGKQEQVEHDGPNERDFIKIGDLVFLNTEDGHYLFSEGVGTVCGTPDDDYFRAHTLDSIFRIQTKFEYHAQKDYSQFLKTQSGKGTEEDAKMTRLLTRAESEKRKNEEDEKVLSGSVVYYGQVIQLVHVSTNMLLHGDKRGRSELDPTSMKIELRKEGNKSAYFKIMPKFKVRFEGEEVRRGDRVCLMHIKTGHFLQFGPRTFDDNGFYEAQLNSSQTGWSVTHFASFEAKSERFVKGGDVFRLYHLEKEGYLKAQITPLYDNKRYEVFVKTKGTKKGKMETKSSNTLFLIESKGGKGGMIAWRSEVRLRHVGTGKFLAVCPKPFTEDKTKLSLMLTEEFNDPNTIFVFHPVDKGDAFISYSSYGRLQSKREGTSPSTTSQKGQISQGEWLHVSDVIQAPTANEGTVTFQRDTDMELFMTDKYYYEDVLSFNRVAPVQVEELNYANSLHSVISTLVVMLKNTGSNLGNSSGDSTPTIRRRTRKMNAVLLPTDTEPAKDALIKLIRFINQASNPLQEDGLPISAHQNLLYEQECIEVCIEVLQYVFGGNPQKYTKENIANMTASFAEQSRTPENKHVTELVSLVYKFLELLVKNNYKIGNMVAKWLHVYLAHMGSAVVGVREALIELFRDNAILLNKISGQQIEAFVDMLLITKKDPRLLELLEAICTCDDSPVFRNQNAIWEALVKHPELIVPQRLIWTKDERPVVEISLNGQKWISLEKFVKMSKRQSQVDGGGALKDSADMNESKGEDSLLVRTKTVSEGEAAFAYKYNPRYLQEIDYFRQQLTLFYSSSIFNDRGVEYLNKGIGRGPLITLDSVFNCLKNKELPGSFRSRYCDLLLLLIDSNFPSIPHSGIKYTWAWKELVENYSTERKNEPGVSTNNNWLINNLDNLKEFMFNYVRDNQKIEFEDKENVQLCLSLLTVLDKMIRYGYFTSKEDENQLVPHLIKMLDGNSEKASKHLQMTETLILTMKSKLMICNILHTYFDLRLEKRTAEHLYKYKQTYEKSREAPVVGSTAVRSKRSKTKSPLRKSMSNGLEMEEIKLETVTPAEESDLQKILMNTLMYEYAPLSASALELLIRHMRKYDELVHTLQRVQLLTDDQSVEIYKEIYRKLAALKDFLQDNDISVEDVPKITQILREFVELCTHNGDLNNPNPKTQIIFKNLGVHTEILRMLRLPYQQDIHHGVFKLCYLFLKQFCLDNKTNQALLYPEIDFMMSQMGMKLNISDTFFAILHNNFSLCSQLDSFFMSHMVKLLTQAGRRPKYLALLDTIVVAEDNPIKENSTSVISLIAPKRDTILLHPTELKKKKFSVEDFSTKKEKETPEQELNRLMKIARIRESMPSLGEQPMEVRVDMKIYDAMSKSKATDAAEEDLLYHISLIDMLAKCSRGFNHVAEALCQSFLSPSECAAVLTDKEAGPLIKGAYCRFLAEVWFYTERALDLRSDQQMWEMLRILKSDLSQFKKLDPLMNTYIFYGIMPLLKSFFSKEHTFGNELNKERIDLANSLLDELCFMLQRFKDNLGELSQTAACIESLKECNIEGFNRATTGIMIADLLEKAKSKEGTVLVKAAKEERESKAKLLELKHYVQSLGDEEIGGRKVLDIEFEKCVQVFGTKLLSGESDHQPATVEDEKAAEEQIDSGEQYVKKLIDQLSEADSKPDLVEDCLRILGAIVGLHSESLEGQIKYLSEAEKKQKRAKFKEQLQTKLGSLGALKRGMELLASTNTQIVNHALSLIIKLLAGGNRELQASMMKDFLNSADPFFFDDIRNRIGFTLSALKSMRRDQTGKRRVKSLDSSELDEALGSESSTQEAEKDNMINLLYFLQNMCEGHYTEMKNYLREQYDNSKTFNIVKETVHLAAELERTIEDHTELGNQLFRTLTEFSSGCPENQLTIAEAKIHVPINRTLMRLPNCDNAKLLELKNSMLELLLSLVEGQFPQKETSTSSIPDILLSSLDFNALQTNMKKALAFSETWNEESAFDRMLDATQNVAQIGQNVAQIGQNVAQNVAQMSQKSLATMKRTLTTRNLLQKEPEIEIPKAAQSKEEADNARKFLSNCIILLKIIGEFDFDRNSKVKRILKKPAWVEFMTANIGSIEVVAEQGEIEKVYFPIPEICKNLQTATKDEFFRTVKRDTPMEKIDDFVRRSDALTYEIYHHTRLASSRVSFLSKAYTPTRNLLFLCIVVINALMIAYAQQPDFDTSDSDDSGSYIWYGKVLRNVPAQKAIQALSIIHLILACVWIPVYVWSWAPVIIYRNKKDKQEEVKHQNALLKKLGKKPISARYTWFDAFRAVLADTVMVYHLVYFVLAAIGVYWPPLLAFHLLDLSARSESTKNVLKSVTTNGSAILLTAMLAILLIYFYTVIAFFGFSGSFNPSENCDSLYYCIVFFLNFGIRSGGGIGDALGDAPGPDDSKYYIGRAIFDVTFFIIIIIILLNIIFGIIIDTFGELRDQKNQMEEDMRNRCFICAIEGDTFQRQASGFKHHIKHDHNVWDYLYFFIYLNNKEEDEYTAVEEYISSKMKSGETDFFPLGKALCLMPNIIKKKKKPSKK